MYRIEYYHADTRSKDSFFKTLKTDALKMLDRFIDNGPGNVKKVTPYRVDFRNGDYARVVDLVPLSAMMLDREDRGYGADDADTIFEDD